MIARKSLGTFVLIVGLVALIATSLLLFRTALFIVLGAVATSADGPKHPEIPFPKIDSNQLEAAARRHRAAYNESLTTSVDGDVKNGPGGRLRSAER